MRAAAPKGQSQSKRFENRSRRHVNSAPLVELRDVEFRYGARPVLIDIDMVVPRGHVVAIMGLSGSGKTTILRLIGGQVKPNRGTVSVAGQPIHQLSHRELYKLRRRMGMLFQFGALFTDYTVFENVAFPLREHTQLPEAFVRDLVMMKLHAVGLRGAAQLKPEALSGGMARRVALARAIALDPMLIMYDEPFTGLDPISTERDCEFDPTLERCAGRHLHRGHARHSGIVQDRGLHLLRLGGAGRGRRNAANVARFHRAVRTAIRARRDRRTGAISVCQRCLRQGPRPGVSQVIAIADRALRHIGHLTVNGIWKLGAAARFSGYLLARSGDERAAPAAGAQ